MSKLKLDDLSKDYNVEVFLRMSWRDPRLIFSSEDNGTLTLLPALIDDIWMPDIFFTNAKNAVKHDVVEESK